MNELDAIDRRVGARLRERRKQRRMTQVKLAALIGVSFQQLQKYERGVNRISASRLQTLCRVLKVAPSYFFDTPSGADLQANVEDLYRRVRDRDVRRLNEAFIRIEAQETRRAVIAFIEAVGASESCRQSDTKATAT